MKTLLLASALLGSALPDDDLVLVGPTLNASWIWAADGVKIRRSGAGAYDGFPVEKDAARPGDAVVLLEVSEAPPGGVLHAGFAFKADYSPVDCSRFAEKGLLEVWLRGDAGGEDLQIGLYGGGSDGSKQMSIVTLSAYGKVGKEWSRVQIPVKDLAAKAPKLDLAKANQVAIHTLPGKSAMTLRLAGIRLTLAAAK